MTYPTPKVSSYFIKDSMFNEIQIQDFCDGKPDSVLQMELEIALSLIDDVNIPCQNIEALYSMSGGKFTLRLEGLEMQCAISNMSGYPVPLIIPWERLKQHSSNEDGIVYAMAKRLESAKKDVKN